MYLQFDIVFIVTATRFTLKFAYKGSYVVQAHVV